MKISQIEKALNHLKDKDDIRPNWSARDKFEIENVEEIGC
jgi:hypothetical protein